MVKNLNAKVTRNFKAVSHSMHNSLVYKFQRNWSSKNMKINSLKELFRNFSHQ